MVPETWWAMGVAIPMESGKNRVGERQQLVTPCCGMCWPCCPGLPFSPRDVIPADVMGWANVVQI